MPKLRISSTPIQKLEFIIELLQQDLLPRLDALERCVHSDREDLRQLHDEIAWLDGHLRDAYPEWYSSQDDDEEEEDDEE